LSSLESMSTKSSSTESRLLTKSTKMRRILWPLTMQLTLRQS
jgi:hypothetical protein